MHYGLNIINIKIESTLNLRGKELNLILINHYKHFYYFCHIAEYERYMKIIDLISGSEHTAFSFEILPPLKGTGIGKLYDTIDTLREFTPKYINITT
ncbi:hypothetical protein EZS27_035785, partial [termite gut metagenome]